LGQAILIVLLLLINSEILYENTHFKGRKLAALLVSKVFFHMQAYNDAMHFALNAGDLFDLSKKTEFTETIIGSLLAPFHPPNQG